MLPALAVLLQIAIPVPSGYVNDFAAVLDPASIAHMDAVIREVKDKTRGEIAVVTLSDIGDREASDVALQIGRQWGVGAKAAAGRSEEHTSELQSHSDLVCRLLLEKKKKK